MTTHTHTTIVGGLAALMFAALLASCQPTLNRGGYNSPVYLGRDPSTTSANSTRIALPSSVEIPTDGSSPKTGNASSGAGSRVRIVTFDSVGKRVHVKNGETVNLIYDGIDPEAAYLRYESTHDGYELELAPRNQFMVVSFETLCQKFIVDHPANAAVNITDDLRYEQVVWTPRSDGLWEVRIGSTSRGCQSEALDGLNKLRSAQYEKTVPR
jgi:hypothetical protein